MKKESLLLLLLAGVLVSLSFSIAPREKNVKIGLIMNQYSTDRWYKDKDYFCKQVEALGHKVIVEASNGIAEKQVEIARDFIKQGVDVLVIVSTDGYALKEAVDAAHKAGIKVIAYDRMIMNCDVDYYISFDSEDVGQEQAKFALKNSPTGKYIWIKGPESDYNSLLMLNGQKRFLQPPIDRGDIEIVLEHQMDYWTYMDTYMAVSDYVAQNISVEVDVALAPSDIVSEAVINAFSDMGATPPRIITGLDATLTSCKYLLRGQQSMTIYKSIKTLGTQAANFAVSVAQGKPNPMPTTFLNNGFKEVPSILLEVHTVTKDNINEIIIKDGYWSFDEIYEE